MFNAPAGNAIEPKVICLSPASFISSPTPSIQRTRYDMLTRARLHSLLHYDPATGIFNWRIGRRGRGCAKGAQAGNIDADGYRVIKIDYKTYRAARLAVLWMTGKWPRRTVDHENCIKDDDRWDNLRSATHQQQAANRLSKRRFKGISFDRVSGRYAARVRVNRRTIWLGRFDEPEQAHAAYVIASRLYFGEFARA